MLMDVHFKNVGGKKKVNLGEGERNLFYFYLLLHEFL